MDLLQTLTTALGVRDERPQAVAGALMSALTAAVSAKAGPAVAQRLEAAVPEVAEWKKAGGVGAAAIDGLAKAMAGGGAPVQGLAAMSQLLLGLGLDPAKAMGLGSVLYGFLQSRLSPDLLAQVARAVPMLSGLGGAAGGALFGMLGGMFGGQGQGQGGAPH